MITLVKVRKNKVLEEIKKAWNIVYDNIRKRTDYEKYLYSYKKIHLGRIVIRYIRRGWFCYDILYPLYENSNIHKTKYFIYGFKLFLMGGYRDISNNYVPDKIVLYHTSTVINILEILSRLNNFEYIINDDTTIHEVVKFLYERERLETDKHIYCSIENKIISLEN